MDATTPKVQPQHRQDSDLDQAGEIFSPEGWRPVERRHFMARCITMLIGGVSGYAAYPWLIGDRRQQLIAQFHQQWEQLNAPRKQKPWRQQNSDLHEDQAVVKAPSRFRPIVLDQEGLAYQKYLYSLNLRHIQPIELLRPHFKSIGQVNNQLPPRELWKNIGPTLKIADALRDLLGVPLISINSAFRCSAYNAACAGAAPNSYHTRNMALDLVYACSPAKVAQAAQTLRSQGKFKGGIGRYSNFVHIDTRGKNADWGNSPLKIAAKS